MVSVGDAVDSAARRKAGVEVAVRRRSLELSAWSVPSTTPTRSSQRLRELLLPAFSAEFDAMCGPSDA